MNNGMPNETVTITRQEYERLCAAHERYEQQYEADYERKAAEMRRMGNQSHEQLAVAVREIQELQARNKELEAALQQSQAVAESVTNCDLAKREGVGE